MSRASSELQEAFRLFRDLAPESAPAPVESAPPVPARVAEKATPSSPSVSPFTKLMASPPLQPVHAPRSPAVMKITGETRAERLEFVLDALCLRASLAGAVLADDSGLPLAAHGRSVATENLAAFTSVLGEALEKAGRFLGHFAADYISMDVDYEHKLVLKRFLLEGSPYYLVVLGPQNVDERSELEVSVGHVLSVLSGR